MTEVRPHIEAAMQSVLDEVREPASEEMHTMMSYHLGWSGQDAGPAAQGKRIRPILVLLATAASGAEWPRALPAAAAVELLHNFSLVHDDIQDDSPLRRGRPTVWKKWGVAQAINTGDALFNLAFRALLGLSQTLNTETALQAIDLLQQTCVSLTRGQYLDLSFESRTQVSLDEYWAMIEGKTASLLAGCLQLGALAGQAAIEKRQAYHRFGRSLGLAFQVQDDILGIWGDAADTGKSVHSDLLAGKKSLPALYGLAQNGPFARRWLQGDIQSEEVADLAAQLKSEGAYRYALAEAERLTAGALQALEQADPQGDAGQALVELTDMLLRRRA